MKRTEAIKQLIEITWFNNKKGYGEGKNEEGDRVMVLKKAYEKGMNKDLQKGDKIVAFVKENDEGLFTWSIPA